MDFCIIEKLDVFPRHETYRQKMLPTEFVLTSAAEVKEEHFTIMRLAPSHLYNWLADDMPYFQLVDYDTLLANVKAAGERFKGTSSYREAWDIELWKECGNDGHTDWYHADSYRILFEKLCPEAYLREVSAQELTYTLAEKARGFDPKSVG